MKNPVKASRLVIKLINEVKAKSGTDIQPGELIAESLFNKTRHLISNIYEDSWNRRKILHEFDTARKSAAQENQWYQLTALLTFLSSMEKDLRSKEAFDDRLNITLPIRKLQSLTDKLKIEEEKNAVLLEKRSAALASLRVVFDQKIHLHKALYISSLIILFQGALFLQVMLNKTNWTATGILAGILLFMALIIAYEETTRQLLSIRNTWTEQFIKKVFVIGGAVVGGYLALLLGWS